MPEEQGFVCGRIMGDGRAEAFAHWTRYYFRLHHAKVVRPRQLVYLCPDRIVRIQLMLLRGGGIECLHHLPSIGVVVLVLFAEPLADGRQIL